MQMLQRHPVSRSEMALHRSTNSFSSPLSGVMSPMKRRRTLSRSMVSMASSRYRFSSSMMVSTSSCGRFQFSVEKA